MASLGSWASVSWLRQPRWVKLGECHLAETAQVGVSSWPCLLPIAPFWLRSCFSLFSLGSCYKSSLSCFIGKVGQVLDLFFFCCQVFKLMNVLQVQVVHFIVVDLTDSQIVLSSVTDSLGAGPSSEAQRFQTSSNLTGHDDLIWLLQFSWPSWGVTYLAIRLWLWGWVLLWIRTYDILCSYCRSCTFQKRMKLRTLVSNSILPWYFKHQTY